jgi:hypothetical protein
MLCGYRIILSYSQVRCDKREENSDVPNNIVPGEVSSGFLLQCWHLPYCLGTITSLAQSVDEAALRQLVERFTAFGNSDANASCCTARNHLVLPR